MLTGSLGTFPRARRRGGAEAGVPPDKGGGAGGLCPPWVEGVTVVDWWGPENISWGMSRLSTALPKLS